MGFNHAFPFSIAKNRALRPKGGQSVAVQNVKHPSQRFTLTAPNLKRNLNDICFAFVIRNKRQHKKPRNDCPAAARATVHEPPPPVGAKRQHRVAPEKE